MRSRILLVVAMGVAALSLWSAWNPGYHYLTRAAVFALVGAVASYFLVRGGGSRYGLTASFLYLSVLLGIALTVDLVMASPDKTESISTWYSPLLLLFLAVAAMSAAATRLQSVSRTGEP